MVLASVAVFFTALRYASAVCAITLCLPVCPSICLSQVGVRSKLPNVSSRKQSRAIAHGIEFSDAKDLGEILRGWPKRGAKYRWGTLKSANFGQHLALWQNGWMDQDTTWYGGKPPTRPDCIRWDPAPPWKGANNLPTFGPYLLWRNRWMDQDTT